MKNKKGFTLIELLAVLTLLAIIMIIAVPNVISIIEKNRKEAMLNDAKRLIAATQYKAAVKTNLLPSTVGSSVTYNLTALRGEGIKDLENDPDGGDYYPNTSYIKIVLDNNKNYVYYVKLCGTKRKINETAEKDLTSIDVVVDGVC